MNNLETQIRRLSVSDPNLTELVVLNPKEGLLIKLFEVLKTNNVLRELSIASTTMDLESVKHLTQILDANNTLSGVSALKTLELYYVNMDPPGIKCLTEALKVNTTLHTFSFQYRKNRDIDRQSMPFWTGYIYEAFGTGDTPRMADECVVYLVEALKVNSTLRTFSLGSTDVHDGVIKSLSEALKVNSTLHSHEKRRGGLRTLDFVGSILGDEGAKYLADFVGASHNTLADFVGAPYGALADFIGASHNTHTRRRGLCTINIRSDRIGPQGIKHLAEALKNNNTLETLRFNECNVGSEGAKWLATALRVNNTLSNLCLNKCCIDNEGARYLADGICAPYGTPETPETPEINNTLQYLNLKGNGIEAEGVKYLAKALETNNTLQYLNLDKNDIGPEGIKYLAQALKINNTRRPREKLIPSRDAHVPLECAAIPRDALEKSTDFTRSTGTQDINEEEEEEEEEDGESGLLTLNLCGSGLGPGDIKDLAEALKVNSSLGTLRLESNNLGPEGAGYLAEALKVNKTLEVLDLEYNHLRCEGVKYLAEALEVNKTLKFLELDGNNIKDVKHLAETLKINISLYSLSIHDNGLGDEGAKHLAEALKFNSTLRSLYLTNDSIDTEGTKYFIEALRTNNTLHNFDIGYDNIHGDDPLEETLRYLADINAALCGLNHEPPGSLEIRRPGTRKQILDVYLTLKHSPECQLLPVELINELMKSYLMELKVH